MGLSRQSAEIFASGKDKSKRVITRRSDVGVKTTTQELSDAGLSKASTFFYQFYSFMFLLTIENNCALSLKRKLIQKERVKQKHIKLSFKI